MPLPLCGWIGFLKQIFDQMKLLLLLFSVGFLSLSSVAQKNKFDLTVTLTGIANKNGMIEFGLYNDPSKFAKVGQTLKTLRVKITSSEAVVTFHDLEPGKYAVCFYHDENNNKSCDKNFLSIPTEAYAFSNNIRPKFSVPTFEECSFSVTKNKSVTARLVY